ncbi:hypothetical protein [Microvirga sp. Mcv34]|uniref:hypothetical protein n=1 Tax=Microvirga sp. Mcv34 TaxID=2926016 RepID=UPI0021C73091|nr:hypothetical protein [Microvirga sp. Mcv34]
MRERSLLENLRNDVATVESVLRKINLFAETGLLLEDPAEKDRSLRAIGEAVRGLVSRNVEPETSKFEGVES